MFWLFWAFCVWLHLVRNEFQLLAAAPPWGAEVLPTTTHPAPNSRTKKWRKKKELFIEGEQGCCCKQDTTTVITQPLHYAFFCAVASQNRKDYFFVHYSTFSAEGCLNCRKRHFFVAAAGKKYYLSNLCIPCYNGRVNTSLHACTRFPCKNNSVLRTGMQKNHFRKPKWRQAFFSWKIMRCCNFIRSGMKTLLVFSFKILTFALSQKKFRVFENF